MAMPTGAQQLRELLAAGPIVMAPGTHDPLGACIIERAGFGAVYLGGNAMGVSLGKGQPLLTLTETVDCLAKIVRTVDIPAIVDAGAGFGDPAHCHRAVIELEAAGAAALHIDDQQYPKVFGYHQAGGRAGLVPAALMAARLQAAAAARRDPQLMLIARTDALRVTGSLDEAIERGRAYAAAGPDALMILDLGPEQAAQFRAALPDVPLIWIGGVTPPVPSARELEQAGFALALYPFNGLAAVADTLTRLWTQVRETGLVPQDDALLRRMKGGLQHIIGTQKYWAIEQQAAHDATGSANKVTS